MAHGTLDPAALIRKQLEDADPDLLRELLQEVVEALMSAEADGLAGAAYGTRSPERTNRRNGYRGRRWDTRVGTRSPDPQAPSGLVLPGLATHPASARRAGPCERRGPGVVEGVSTRRVEDLVQALGIASISKSQVSEMAKALDDEVEAFRRRPLDRGPYRVVSMDALALRVREGGRIVSAAALVAVGVDRDGRREILGLDVVTVEDGTAWTSFLRDLVARGLSGVAIVTSDAHEGLKAAIAAVLPGASWRAAGRTSPATCSRAYPRARSP